MAKTGLLRGFDFRGFCLPGFHAKSTPAPVSQQKEQLTMPTEVQVRLLQVYLLYPVSQQDIKHLDSARFFTRPIASIERRVRTHPLFFELAKAKVHSRFLGAEFAVIAAMVPEHCIVANGESLQLRQGGLDIGYIKQISLMSSANFKTYTNPLRDVA